jgi:HTH-type transcriptional regulator / antitoxin MqsA
MIMRKAKTQPCPSCGGKMRFEKRTDTLLYKGQERPIQTQAWWCEACDEAILAGDALRARELEFQKLKAEVDQVLAPAEVAAVRSRLGLSQRKAGELLGGGPRAFQKYEAGTQAVSAPMSHLLTLLANDPTRLDELRDVVKGTPRRTAGQRARTTPASARRQRQSA